jgi:hypothetical protein
MTEENYSTIGDACANAINDTVINIIASGDNPNVDIASASDINSNDKI